jgi:hypothetical protein
MTADFRHIQSAHCENGVTSNLLRHAGISKITEPLAFGIGSGIFFFYLPFILINNGPFITFRTMPGLIFMRTCKTLGIPIVRRKFNNEQEARKTLDEYLAKGQPVGCQVGIYYLVYFPKEYRFHFNAHNLVVFGKEGDRYLVSDPVMEEVTSLTGTELDRVRFARGPLAPKGRIYFPLPSKEVPEEVMRKAIRQGILRSVRDMIRIPGPFAGTNGIAWTGKKIRGWKHKLGLQKAGLYLAQLVRMQEEIGTGGGGFRFIYAAFLQEANTYIQRDELLKASEIFTKSGDLWRDVAVQSAGIYKGRLSEQADFDRIADQMQIISQTEKEGFRILAATRWS